MRHASTAERLLCAQIHPLRLAVSAVTGAIGLYLLSRQMLVIGIVLAVAPTVIACIWLMRGTEIHKRGASDASRYVRRWMTPFAYAERLAGFALMCLAAWSHSYPLMAFGFALIAHAWTAGLLIGKR